MDGVVVGMVTVRVPIEFIPNQIIISDPLPRATALLSSRSLKSVAVDISLQVPVPKGRLDAQICMVIEDKEDQEDMCLAFFNESKGRWFCQDSDLQRGSKIGDKTTLCGGSDHFTNFAVLLVGQNQGSSYNYFTGTWRGDVGIAGGLLVVLLLIGVVVIGLSYIPAFRKLYYGAEGARVHSVRDESRTISEAP